MIVLLPAEDQHVRLNIGKAFTGSLVPDQQAYLKQMGDFSVLPGGKLRVQIESEGVRYGGGRIALNGKFFDRKNLQINSVFADNLISSPTLDFGYLPNGFYALGVTIEGVRYFAEDVEISGKDIVLKIALKVGAERTIVGRVSNVPDWSNTALIKNGIYAAKVDQEGFYTLKSRHIGDDIAIDCMIGRQVNGDFVRELILFRFSLAAGQTDFALPRYPLNDRPVVSGRVRLSEELASNGYGKLLQNLPLYFRKSDGSVVIHLAPKENGDIRIYDILDGEYTADLNGGSAGLPLLSPGTTFTVKDGKCDPIEIVVQ